MWNNEAITDLLGVELPIIQAPMAAASGYAMAVAVAKAGGLGSIPCAMLDVDNMREEINAFRRYSDKPLNVNFFCHASPPQNPKHDETWEHTLAPYYEELGLNQSPHTLEIERTPFNEKMCEVVEELRPEIISFHFGLPSDCLLKRVKATGARILGCATTIEEALFLESNGCDAVIAQGYEAGGHRSMFLTDNVATQTGTFSLLPQMVDALEIPVIAAGGIADGRGVLAAFVFGAIGVQIGTAYLLTSESLISSLHRTALEEYYAGNTAVTNLLSGRPARGIVNRIIREHGPISDLAPQFPRAGNALASLKANAESKGINDFSSLWAGQSPARYKEISAHALTQMLAEDALRQMRSMTTREKQHHE